MRIKQNVTHVQKDDAQTQSHFNELNYDQFAV